jgi:AcrR family transcriptional regulator
MTDVSQRRERARPLSPEERRAAIVEATVPLVITQGGAVTTKLIAEAAGVAEGTIFRVFPDKRALFHAVAEHVMNPPGDREDLAQTLAGLSTLRDKVVGVAERMELRSYRVMTVMMALRSVLMAEGPPSEGPPSEHTHEAGPPKFLVDARQQLLDNLTELLFAPHAEELRTDPEHAALALRSLVLGARHPGMDASEPRLTSEQVADVLLSGVAAHPAPGRVRP